VFKRPSQEAIVEERAEIPQARHLKYSLGFALCQALMLVSKPYSTKNRMDEATFIHPICVGGCPANTVETEGLVG
jgi:hypothetical protein